MESTKKIHIQLSKEQTEDLNKWFDAIKLIYGEVGIIEYRIRFNGIGPTIKVYSELTNTEIDLTDVENW